MQLVCFRKVGTISKESEIIARYTWERRDSAKMGLITNNFVSYPNHFGQEWSEKRHIEMVIVMLISRSKFDTV